MPALVDRLSDYAAYHRDPRNIATHILGIPLIVLAVAILLSRPAITVGGGLRMTPAMIVSGAAAIFYLRLDRRFGVAMTVLLGLACWVGVVAAALPTAGWLAFGVGGFVAGWIIQFVGHYFEGRKPAFVDDIAGLVVGPLFVVAEITFRLGWRREVLAKMTARMRHRSPG